MKLTSENIKSIFSERDFKLGDEYVKDGRVYHMESDFPKGLLRVRCCVSGTEEYKVSFQENKKGYMEVSCSCPQFARAGRCKHLAAAMICYCQQQEKSDITDRYAQEMLRGYLDRSRRQNIPPEVPARLVPCLQLGYSYHKGDYPAFSFRVGRERLYVVKNIQEFLDHVDKGDTVVYGKGLTLDQSIQQFDAQSQAIIALLKEEAGHYRAFKNSYYRYAYANDFSDSQIILVGEAFDKLFDLLSGQYVGFGRNESVHFCTEDPKVSLAVKAKGKGAQLQISTTPEAVFFGEGQYLYALSSDALMRCSAEFREKVYPLLAQNQKVMTFSQQDLPTFCGCVLPELQDNVELDDPDGIMAAYTPEDCTPLFYFDMDSDTLYLKPAFRYGNREISAFRAPSDENTVRRNIKEEYNATALAEQYFRRGTDAYILDGEDNALAFLVESLDKFRQCGEVYLSDRLARRKVQPKNTDVNLSVSDGLLELSFDTGDFPPEELTALYESLLLRRRYHRLKDGRYLELNGSSYEKMAEMARMLQLSKQELAKGKAELPAYRGLYLDELLADSEGIQVSRDAKFRSMVRNFKAVSDSDYVPPENLEQVMRSYQKTGYRWLKTLENYGFGGILADEMGLGKTLQAIAFLATVPAKTVGKKSLVVCPASLIYNWGEELQKFAPQLSVTLILGTAAQRKALREQGSGADVWVTSYELLRQDSAAYEAEAFYSCFLDEAQHIKNSVTQISKDVKKINARQRFVLTGTPIENRLSELWNLFDFLMPGYLFSKTAFQEKLEKPILKSKNPDAQQQLRRRKQDVLKELPPKEEYVRPIALTEQEQKTYYAYVQSVKDKLWQEDGKLQILAALTHLRQICCDPHLCFVNYDGPASKMDACLELCEAMTENGHQILLFSQFTTMLDRIRERLDAAGITSFTLQGSTSKEKRARMVKDFQAGKASVFLISLKAGGTGLNLTKADVVIHYDPWWNQAAQDQATDRAHRIGQHACVQVYKLIAKDTIEEKIMNLQSKKAALLDAVAEDGDTGILDMSREELLALLDVGKS